MSHYDEQYEKEYLSKEQDDMSQLQKLFYSNMLHGVFILTEMAEQELSKDNCNKEKVDKILKDIVNLVSSKV